MLGYKTRTRGGVELEKPMKRVIAAAVAMSATLLSLPALAANGIRTSAQPINSAVNNAALTFDLLTNETVMGANITGLTASGATITIEGSTDARADSDPNKVWFSTVAIPFTCPSPSTFTTISADEPFKIDVSGLTNLRFRISSTGTGTVLVGLNAIQAATLGSCGGTGGGGGGGNVNLHDGSGNPINSTGGALDVTGTFTASLGGFTPSSSGARMAALTVQVTDSSQTLPTGAVVVVSNSGTTNPMFCNVNGVAATTADQPIGPNGGWFAFTIPATITALHCIATGGITTATGVGGAGLPTGVAAGGGGSGSNASVGATGSAVPSSATYVGMTVGGNLTGLTGTSNGLKVDGSAVTQPVSAASLPLPSGAATSALQTTGNSTLTTINSTLGSPMQNTGGSVTVAGPLGAQSIGSTVAVNSQAAADPTPTTGNITTVDAGTSCSSTPNFQTACTGTATTGSFVSTTLTAAGSLAVSGSISGGTATVILTVEVSQDNATWYARGLFLDSNAAPIWHNSLSGFPFSGITNGGGLAYYRVRASTFTVLTGSPVIAISIRPGQQQAMPYVGNLPTASAGTNSVAAINVQGITSGVPVITNQTQSAGVSLGAPTAVGTQGTGNAPNINATIVGGSVSATFSPFGPNNNYAALAAGSSSARVALPSGTSISIENQSSNGACILLGSSTVSATSSGGLCTSDNTVPGNAIVGMAVGSNTYIAAIEQASGSSTNLVISGGSGGVSGLSSGGSGGGGGSGTADANLSLAGTISAANTGATVQNWTAQSGGATGQGYSSGGAELTGTPTTNSAMSTSGFSGWNSIWVECTGLGSAGTNWFEIDTSGASGGTLQKRQVAFTGPTFSGAINAAAATFLNIMADQYASGTPSCSARGSQNFATAFAGNGPVVGNLTQNFSVSSATTTRVVTGVANLSVVVTGVEDWTDGSVSGQGSVQFVSGTGSTCGTGQSNVGAVMNFPGGQGIAATPPSQHFTLKPGDSLCVTTTGSNNVLGNVLYTLR